MIESYPLQWPAGYKRTPDHRRTNSKFKQTPEAAQNILRNELRIMGGTNLIISSNVNVRKDGFIYFDMANSPIEEPGVAIYFKYKGKDISMCCDQFRRPWENLYALAKGIEALRGMERWGVSEFLDRAFTGFKALPEATMADKEIWKTLALPGKPAHEEHVHSAYKQQAKKVHPDVEGGSRELFDKLQHAYHLAQNFFQ
jgi:hypothetical protein